MRENNMNVPAPVKSLAYRMVGAGLPVFSALRFNPANEALGVIMVHGVYPAARMDGVPVPGSSVILANMEVNLRNVKGYSFVSIDEAAAMLDGTAPLRKRCLVLTFDDSLKSHAEVIAPRLVQWGIPATFYVSTEVIEDRKPYWWLRLEYAIAKLEEKSVIVTLPNNERVTIEPEKKWDVRRKITFTLHTSCKPSQCEQVVEAVESQVGIDWKKIDGASPYAGSMTWDDVRELDRLGFTVGSHTCSHPNLTLLDAGELRGEMEQSKQTIEKQIGKPCRHLSYPHGHHSDQVCAAARAAGYITAVTTDASDWNRKGNDLLRLRRFPLPKPAYKLSFVLSGAAQFFNS
jgi:peptidoglycan/xylan/chitin deacetylase (PgdA/CDA1 family)